MRSTLVLRLLIFGGCLMLEVHKCSSICGTNQYTITWANDSVKRCLNCGKCHAGLGQKPTCGERIRDPPKGIGCISCVDGETFSNEYNSAPCSSCHKCAEHEIVAANCTTKSDTNCSGMCIQGYYFSQKPKNDCQKCSYCCFDGKDEIQPDCVNQGLNASSQHCSPRVDRNCGPDPTTMKRDPNIQPTTAAVTDSSSASKVTVIALGTVGGVLLSALVVVSVLYMRQRKAQTRTDKQLRSIIARFENGAVESPEERQLQVQDQTPVALVSPRIQALQNDAFTPSSHSQSATPEVSPTETPCDTEDELGSLPDVKARNPKTLRRQNSKETQNVQDQAPQTSVALVSPRIQALQNNGFTLSSHSLFATPEVSPTETPCDTEDELDSLPDVKAHNPKTLRRQNSKEIQNADHASESLIKGDYFQSRDSKGQEVSKGAEGGHHRRRSSGSLQILARKLSLTKSSDYEPLAGEDPDESQESVMIEEHPISQRQIEGSRVELKCKVKHNKNVTFQWLLDGTKIQGQVNSTLVLDSVKLRDFGWYTCEVKTTNGRPCQVESRPAVLDVTPRDGMKLKLLTDVFKDSFDVQEKVQKLLSKNIDGVGGCKRIAAKYKMDVSDLDGGNSAGERVLSYLGARLPNLTAYDFCKTLKGPKIGRLDIVKELLDHLSLPQEQPA